MATNTKNKTSIQAGTHVSPKKTNRSHYALKVHLTPTERLLIGDRAKKAGWKLGEWFRKAAKSAKIVPRVTIEEAGWFRMLAGIANNLNLITELAKLEGLLTLALKCQSTLKQVEELLNKLNSRDR